MVVEEAPPLVHQHGGQLVVNEVQSCLSHALRHAPYKPLPVPCCVPFILAGKEASTPASTLPLSFSFLELCSGQLQDTGAGRIMKKSQLSIRCIQCSSGRVLCYLTGHIDSAARTDQPGLPNKV